MSVFNVRRGVHVILFITLIDSLGALAIWYSNLSRGYVRTVSRACWAGHPAGVRISARAAADARRVSRGLCRHRGLVADHLRIERTAVAARCHRAALATVQGTQVTITHNIRNLNYQTETDFDLRYYDKTFDLDRLDSVNLTTVYWMGDAIAHVIVTFGFRRSRLVTFSIETPQGTGRGILNPQGVLQTSTS